LQAVTPYQLEWWPEEGSNPEPRARRRRLRCRLNRWEQLRFDGHWFAPPRRRAPYKHRYRRISAAVLERERVELPVVDDLPERPKTRGDCRGHEGPCPWVGCRYHLYLDVEANGSIKLNFPDLEPDEMLVSCALDVAEGGGARLCREVADQMNLSREGARQVELVALRKLRSGLKAAGLVVPDFGGVTESVWDRIEDEA
jgi:hypothetical protein